MKFIQSKLFASILGALLFLVTTAMVIPAGIAVAPPSEDKEEAAHKHGPVNTRGPSWDFFNPELDQVVAELKMEKEGMSVKKKQLDELDARLKAERAELDEAGRKVAKMRDEVSRDVLKIKDDEAANLKRLAKMYMAMEPAGAAKILAELDDAVVVKIMTLMKDADSGLILDALAKSGADETKRAAKISENLRLAVAQKPATK